MQRFYRTCLQYASGLLLAVHNKRIACGYIPAKPFVGSYPYLIVRSYENTRYKIIGNGGIDILTDIASLQVHHVQPVLRPHPQIVRSVFLYAQDVVVRQDIRHIHIRLVSIHLVSVVLAQPVARSKPDKSATVLIDFLYLVGNKHFGRRLLHKSQLVQRGLREGKARHGKQNKPKAKFSQIIVSRCIHSMLFQFPHKDNNFSETVKSRERKTDTVTNTPEVDSISCCLNLLSEL